MDANGVLSALFDMPAADAKSDLRAFLRSHGPAGRDDGPTYFARLLRVATRATTRGRGSVAGHQAAIRRLFPATPDGAVVAFCVSEDQGPRPSHIHTSLTPLDDGDDGGAGFVLNGHKRWASISPVSDLLYVAASIGRRDDGRNQLRMVALPTDRPGLTIDTEPYPGWDHHPIADLHLDAVPVRADEVHADADAYEVFIKPFRLVEDVYNTAGSFVALFRHGRAAGWPTASLERIAGLVVSAAAISETDMASPEAVVLMADYFRRAEACWQDAWAQADCSPQVDEDWMPERGLLGVAAAARDTRRERAWESLAG